MTATYCHGLHKSASTFFEGELKCSTVSAVEQARLPVVMEFVQLKREIARRLKELREDRFHGITPEEVAERAKERRLKIAPRTIRDYENPETCNPTITTLQTLLTLYGSSLGDLFRFTASAKYSAEVAAFLRAMEDDDLRMALMTLLERLIPRP